MKLVTVAKLIIDDDARLRALVVRVNEACDWLAERAFEAKVADKLRLQKLHYRELRERFGLSAQHAIRCIAKVCEVYKCDRSKLPRFRPLGAITFDQRTYSMRGNAVSLTMLDGRIRVPFVCHKPIGRGGQADLVFRGGKWFLYLSVEVPEAALVQAADFLGVDLGIVNLAVDSDGAIYSGDGVERVRSRYLAHRTALQARGTKSAKRRLKKIAGREARYRHIENHRISKHLVQKAEGTGRGIAIEDLSKIRERTTVRKSQRAKQAGWSFFQLRTSLEYKARRAGVPLVVVDPRNTSRTCPACGHAEKANRRDRNTFCCVKCGMVGHADLVGAENIRRAAVNQPIVGGADPVASRGAD